MIEIKGSFNSAVCYTGELEESAAQQIKAVCDFEAFEGCRIRIMPDVHAGMGCTIGTTMTIRDKVVPGMVGVDIGCGMEAVKLDIPGYVPASGDSPAAGALHAGEGAGAGEGAESPIDFAGLEALIRSSIPFGRDIRKKTHPLARETGLDELRCAKSCDLLRAWKSIGTLGGGNHFIEIDRGVDGAYWLVVPSGSRHLGLEIAGYYQREALKELKGSSARQIAELIEGLKAEGRFSEIEAAVKEAKRGRNIDIPKDLAYVQGQLFDDYINDMRIAQRFAGLNRRAMADTILEGMGWGVSERFATVHNYIDTESMILRKGAGSAGKGEKLLIPINMRDGSLICEGLGNEDWNCSAPHGAGRIMSRGAAFSGLSMDEYREQMRGIYSSCVNEDTLDESPMAYKSMDAIVSNIGPTARILERIVPVYNFKASE